MYSDEFTKGVYPPIFHMYRKFNMYVLRFFKDFKWRYVVIDDRLPMRDLGGTYNYIFGKCSTKNELWVPLIEKAYAKLHGCYETLISGFLDDGLSDMTGHVSEKMQLWDPKTENFPHKSCGDKD